MKEISCPHADYECGGAPAVRCFWCGEDFCVKHIDEFPEDGHVCAPCSAIWGAK